MHTDRDGTDKCWSAHTDSVCLSSVSPFAQVCAVWSL